MARILLLIILPATTGNAAARNLLQDLMPPQSPVLNGYRDIDSLRNSITTRQLSPIEGLWQLSGNQATVIIEPSTLPAMSTSLGNLPTYQIVVVSSPRKSVRPGTVLGYFTPAGRDHCYDTYMYTSRSRNILKSHRRFTLTLSTDDRFITLTPIKSRWRLSLRHTFNFLMRAYVSNNDPDTPAPDGFIKLYPMTGKPHTPIYL